MRVLVLVVRTDYMLNVCKRVLFPVSVQTWPGRQFRERTHTDGERNSVAGDMLL